MACRSILFSFFRLSHKGSSARWREWHALRMDGDALRARALSSVSHRAWGSIGTPEQRRLTAHGAGAGGPADSEISK